MNRNLAQMQQTVDSQLANVAGQLNAMEKEMYAAMSDLEQMNKDNSTELVQIRTRFETIQGQLHLALVDLENVATAASRAEAGSRQAIKLQQDGQLAERQRLQNQLRDLDVQISHWYQPEGPTEQLRPDLHPESSYQTTTAQSGKNTGNLPPAGLQIPDTARNNGNR